MSAGLVAIAATLCAHAAEAPPAADPSPRPPMARVDLQGNSPTTSRAGHAHLVLRADSTDVVVQVPPANGMTLPMHLYTYLHQGSCGSLGPATAEATRRVLGYREPSGLWTVRNTLPVGANTLRASPHALAVRSGPADGNQLLYCGDLRLS
ncbi:hypothetical protein GCM10027034_40140 [Ramlibacter solisilvae]|uniref:Uncharacterized protein n=2 Tax=Ramlibacter tataouinensis TaxID=94132 RepID=A0A127JUB5_9BURK|nr:hypothetical protein UC35_11955 [Ramlibacter tataouinensis]